MANLSYHVRMEPRYAMYCERKVQQYGLKSVREYLTLLIQKEMVQENSYNERKTLKMQQGEEYVIFKNAEFLKVVTPDAEYQIEKKLEDFDDDPDEW